MKLHLAKAAVLTLALGLAVSAAVPVHAAINSMKLGARYNATASAVTFRVYSSRATRIEVFLYKDAMGGQEIARFPLTRNTTTGVWSRTRALADLKSKLDSSGTVYYGYRAWGPNWPYKATWTKGSSVGFISDVDGAGNRFNPNKLLLDPYALEISHDPSNPVSIDGTVYASGAQYRLIDSGPLAPKGIVLKTMSENVGTRPTRALKDEVIYETHVRGLTRNDTSLPPAVRGTYKGAAMKAAQLAALGVTAVEFLPVQETQNDANDFRPNSTADANYWGYMTLNYFAPDRRYAFDRSPGGPTREFAQMVKAYHDVGIKVYIDVVYNHTGEGGAWNGNDKTVFNLYSWRGLDNPTYYVLTQDLQFNYDNTGVGGNYNTYNPIAQNLIVDSLAYWRDTLGVDGFRFDLASVLGNTCTAGCFNFDKMDPKTALNRIVRELPPRPEAGGAGIDLIAEPWAIGGNSFQVGGFPAGWAEWNGLFRDTFRKSQNQLGVANVPPGQMATFIGGSSHLYQNNGRRPWHSINFMVAHDGFTLHDLYACNHPSNKQAWPWGPSDGGSDDNISWDHGGSAVAQRQSARNGMAFLMLAAGVPMVTGGDEYLRSIRCNNNPYNLDSEGNWQSWSPTPEQAVFADYTRSLINFRKQHPALRPAVHYLGTDSNGNGMEQMRWFKPSGEVADAGFFNGSSNTLAWRIDGTEFKDPAAAIYVAYNGSAERTSFVLPWPGDGRMWYRVTDTAAWNEKPQAVAAPGSETLIGGERSVYSVHGRSVVVLIAR